MTRDIFHGHKRIDQGNAFDRPWKMPARRSRAKRHSPSEAEHPTIRLPIQLEASLVLNQEDVRLLAHLSIGGTSTSTRAMSAALRRARMQGSGLEFHEYRHYQPGDDPRTIDWTIEARLQQLVVRVARADGHLALHALVDASASMSIGSPDKFSFARRVAAALCYVALERRDSAGVATFDHDVRARLAPATGREHLLQVLGTLGAQHATGASDLTAALTRYGTGARGPGLAVVISDFLAPTVDLAGLDFLTYRGLAPAAIQVLAPEEIEPSFDLAELLDVEDGTRRGLVVDRGAFAAYRTRFQAHQASLRASCAERGIPFLSLESSSPVEHVLQGLEGIGLLSRHG